MKTSVVVVTTDGAVTAMFTLVRLRCAHHCESIGKLALIAVTALSVTIAVTPMDVYISLSQNCHYHCSPSAVTFSAVTVSIHCCHNAVLAFDGTALCLFSLSQRSAHRYLTAKGFLLCKRLYTLQLSHTTCLRHVTT